MSQTYKVSSKITSKVYFRETRVRSFQERYGLDGMYLPSVLWELTRMSFVVDWWLNVGDWLMSMTVDTSREVLGSMTSVKTTSETINSFRGGHLAPGICKFTKTRLERIITADRPPAFPVVNMSVDSIKHSIDGLSLLWQHMPKQLRR